MRTLMQKLDFSYEEMQFFLNLYQRLTMEYLAQIESLKRTYLNPGTDRVRVNLDTKAALTALAEKIGTHPYSLHMLFVLLCAQDLPKRYRERGLEEKYAWNMLEDIRAKLTECEKCHGIMGSSAVEWFHAHFLMTRFGLGYFQYEPYKWDLDVDYDFGSIHLTMDDPVYKIHIPSSGRMTREARLQSYCAAHDFFGYKKGEPIIFLCRTWLLYEGYRDVFPEGSNLRDFMDDFDLIWHREAEKFNDAWRVFYRDYDGDTSVLPRDTTLQRNFIEYIENGGKFGFGTGVIICDGERILNNKRDN